MCELFFDPAKAAFCVTYREITAYYKEQQIPQHCVKAWLHHFTRNETGLQPDSYYLTKRPSEEWRQAIMTVSGAMNQ
jgi:hypothetical protein